MQLYSLTVYSVYKRLIIFHNMDMRQPAALSQVGKKLENTVERLRSADNRDLVTDSFCLKGEDCAVFK